MDRVATCRDAAREAVADVEPPALHDRIADTLETASMTPGVFTLACAATLASKNGSTATASHNGDGTGDHDSPLDMHAIAHHAAGVQLIYEGLKLTRTLSHDEPWETTDGDTEADLDILAADILVARGFYLLARTDAATTAVRTVRHFGRDQTLRREADAAEAIALDGNLERDVLTLAVRTGATAVDTTAPTPLFAIAADIAADAGTAFPPALDCLPAADTLKALESRADADGKFASHDVEQGLADTHTDRAASAGDP